MQSQEPNRTSPLQLNRETLRTLTQARPSDPQADDAARVPDFSWLSLCCSKGCITDEE